MDPITNSSSTTTTYKIPKFTVFPLLFHWLSLSLSYTQSLFCLSFSLQTCPDSRWSYLKHRLHRRSVGNGGALLCLQSEDRLQFCGCESGASPLWLETRSRYTSLIFNNFSFQSPSQVSFPFTIFELLWPGICCSNTLLLIGEDFDKQSPKDLTKQSEGESPNNEHESKVYIFFCLVSNLNEHLEKIGRLDLFFLLRLIWPSFVSLLIGNEGFSCSKFDSVCIYWVLIHLWWFFFVFGFQETLGDKRTQNWSCLHLMSILNWRSKNKWDTGLDSTKLNCCVRVSWVEIYAYTSTCVYNFGIKAWENILQSIGAWKNIFNLT